MELLFHAIVLYIEIQVGLDITCRNRVTPPLPQEMYRIYLRHRYIFSNPQCNRLLFMCNNPSTSRPIVLTTALERIELVRRRCLVLRLLSTNWVPHRVSPTTIRPNVLQSLDVVSHYPPCVVVNGHLRQLGCQGGNGSGVQGAALGELVDGELGHDPRGLTHAQPIEGPEGFLLAVPVRYQTRRRRRDAAVEWWLTLTIFLSEKLTPIMNT